MSRWPFVSRRKYEALEWQLARTQEQVRREVIMQLNIPILAPYPHGEDSVALYGTKQDVEKFRAALSPQPKPRKRGGTDAKE